MDTHDILNDKDLADTKYDASSIGKEIGVDPLVILETSHGRRSIDTLKILAPEKANWECRSSPSLPIMYLHLPLGQLQD